MSSSSSPCAACKLLRRKCTQGCVFAPYFPPDQPSKFANVHKVFGASNVSKLLNDLPVAQREDAVNSLAYEAEARLHDPVYGCVAYISILQLRIKQVREEIVNARKELAGYIGHQAAFAPVVPAGGMHQHHPALAQAHYAGMGLNPHQQHQHQQMAIQQQAPHQYHPLHQSQIIHAQHMAAAAEVEATQGDQRQHQQDMMMMRQQGYGAAACVPMVAIVPPGPGSADPAAYDGAPAQFLIQQQQPTPSALTTFRMEQQSPPPQSSGHSHVDMSHAPQHQHRHHTDGSDEGSEGAPPPA